MDVNAIFDAVSKVSAYVHLQDAMREKQEQIRNVKSRRCGNCFYWMKSSCVPEKKHKQFKSCDSFGCNDFELCPFSKKLAVEFNQELEELKVRMSNINNHTSHTATE